MYRDDRESWTAAIRPLSGTFKLVNHTGYALGRSSICFYLLK